MGSQPVVKDSGHEDSMTCGMRSGRDSACCELESGKMLTRITPASTWLVK